MKFWFVNFHTPDRMGLSTKLESLMLLKMPLATAGVMEIFQGSDMADSIKWIYYLPGSIMVLQMGSHFYAQGPTKESLENLVAMGGPNARADQLTPINVYTETTPFSL